MTRASGSIDFGDDLYKKEKATWPSLSWLCGHSRPFVKSRKEERGNLSLRCFEKRHTDKYV